MAFSEKYCNASTGSNMNGGTDEGSAKYSVTNGGWNSGTGVFTPASGNPSSVSPTLVGQDASVFIDGATAPVFLGRVTAVSATTVTVSTTAKSGTAPTTNATARSINVGGVWKGPNGAAAFPFVLLAAAQSNAAADPVRVNFKNNSTYSITAAMVHALVGFVQWEGYTTTAGDGGRATIDGGTSGASYALLTIGGGNDGHILKNLIFGNNGATGSATGVVMTTAGGGSAMIGCVVHDVRGIGIQVAIANVIECETYNCNQSNTSALAGFSRTITSNQSHGIFSHCIAHDNSGSNTAGFQATGLATLYCFRCIADTNGGIGFKQADAYAIVLESCDAYNNGSHGVSMSISSTFSYTVQIQNCNFVKNGGFGIQFSTTGQNLCGRIANCGFGSGTQVNTSGTTSNAQQLDVTGTITYASDVTPWVDPANGDLRINLATAKGTGRGTFTQTAASYAGTVGYPDVGAATLLAPVGRGVIVQNIGTY